MIEFLNTNNGAIQAIVAVFNLLLIGYLTYIGINLQNKNYSMEIYSKIQQEIISCLNLVNESIRYFHACELKSSQYLGVLNTHNAGDPPNEDYAYIEIKNLNEILYKLRNIKIMIDDRSTLIDLHNPNNKQLVKELSIINSFKLSFTRNDPVHKYETCLHGAESLSLDTYSCLSNAHEETIEALKELEELLRAH